MQRGDKFRYLRKLMALPCLPLEHVPAAYEQLLDQAEEVSGPILDVTKADNWSVFRKTVRTNNDVEGWHRRIKTRAGSGDLGIYLLAPLLRREAETVEIQIRLVSDHLLTRIHRRRYREVHGRLFEAWDAYEEEDITTTQLLRRCSSISGLGTVDCQDPIHDEN